MEPTQTSATPTSEVVTPAPGDPPEAVRSYEFSEQENRLLSRLASRMSFVGLFSVGTGILVVAMGILHRYHWSIVSGTIYTLLGLWTHRASVSFRDVVETRGSDISHLMQALDDLRKLYNLQYWICFLALVLAAGLFLGALVVFYS